MSEYFILCNPKKYDVENAFDNLGTLEWRQKATCLKHIEVNDIVYIYVCEPVKQVRYKCVVLCTDIPYDNTTIADNQYQIKPEVCDKYMKLKLIAKAKTIITNKDIEDITKEQVRFPKKIISGSAFEQVIHSAF